MERLRSAEQVDQARAILEDRQRNAKLMSPAAPQRRLLLQGVANDRRESDAPLAR